MCEYCSNRFESPVILPCGETICLKDLRGVFFKEFLNIFRLILIFRFLKTFSKDLYKEDEENVIMCFFCNNEHRIIKDSLPTNKVVSKLLSETIMDMENFKFTKYQRTKKLCTLLKHKLDHVKKIENDPSEYLDIFFNHLVKQIDSSRDNCKHLMDKIHENMVNNVNLFRFEVK